jgi:hypothetical protein
VPVSLSLIAFILQNLYSEVLYGSIRVLFLMMLDEMGTDIRIHLEEKEEYQYRQSRVDPDNLQDNYHDTAKDNGKVHRDDPPVGGKELVVDIS